MTLKNKKLFLLDMDGTIYLDDYLFDGVHEFLSAIRARSGKYIFMTNNSSKSVDAYISKLSSLGIEATADDFMTSVDATIQFLAEKYKNSAGAPEGCDGEDAGDSDSKSAGFAAGGKLIYLMGTKSFEEQMRASGFNITTEPSDDVEIILCGFDRELTYKKLEDICRMLSDKDRQIDYYATNPDWVCPTDFGYVPDCGSMCQMIEIATGRAPYFIGKPQPDMALLSMQKTGFEPSETIVVGDRLYTDIACGVNAGVDTCFVLSGEGVIGDIEKYNIEPTFIMQDIKELLGKL